MYDIVGVCQWCQWCQGKLIRGKHQKTVVQCMDCGKNKDSDKARSAPVLFGKSKPRFKAR